MTNEIPTSNCGTATQDENGNIIVRFNDQDIVEPAQGSAISDWLLGSKAQAGAAPSGRVERNNDGVVAFAREQKKPIIIDFGKQEFVSSVLMVTLLELHNKSKESSIPLILTNMQRSVFEPFKTTGLNALLKIHHKPAEEISQQISSAARSA